MRNVYLLALLVLFGSGSVYAGEHRACRDISYPYLGLSSNKLRAIAATCNNEEIAKLFYNRAYHSDLASEARTYAGLMTYSRGTGSTFTTAPPRIARFRGYLLYISLIEQFASERYPDLQQRARFLNREYDSQGEIAELRLRGYEHMANHRERQLYRR
jgi:hypothetical protein